MNYNGFKKESFPVRLIKGFGYLLAADIMAAIVIMYTNMMYTKYPILKAVVGAATLFLVLGLMFNYAYNMAKNDLVIHRNYKDIKPDTKMPLKIALIVPSPILISYILLVLSKLGVIGNFLPAFKLMNMFFVPLIDYFAHDPDIAKMHGGWLAVIFLLSVLPSLTFYISYQLVYRNVDVKKLIMYD